MIQFLSKKCSKQIFFQKKINLLICKSKLQRLADSPELLGLSSQEELQYQRSISLFFLKQQFNNIRNLSLFWFLLTSATFVFCFVFLLLTFIRNSLVHPIFFLFPNCHQLVSTKILLILQSSLSLACPSDFSNQIHSLFRPQIESRLQSQILICVD